MKNISFFCFIFLGYTEARGRCSQGERVLYGREPNGVRAEPGKEKPRSCRAQELARSSAQENAGWKKGSLPNSSSVGDEEYEQCQQRAPGGQWKIGMPSKAFLVIELDEFMNGWQSASGRKGTCDQDRR
jgi:hypothetical protein